MKLTGRAKPSKTCRLTGTSQGLARQDAACRVFGQFWNRTKPFLWSEPGPLACHLDLLLTLIILEAHNSWVQYTQSEEDDLDNTFQGRIPSFPVLYFSWTPPYQIIQCQERLPAGKAISMFSKRCSKTQQWVLCPQAQEYAAVIPTKFKDLHGWADCVDGFIRVVKQTNKMHIVPLGAIV